MQLTLSTLREEQIDALLYPPDPLHLAIYQLYRCRPVPSPAVPRTVLIATESDWNRLPPERRAASIWLEPDDACQVLWGLLAVNGLRAGQVLCGGEPNAADYVFHRQNGGYRVALPLMAQDGPKPAAERAYAV